ncbi:hypothetical protein [Histidinibacterium lentulum]|uniref:hypothetical protein n=1 Tax=Histidinibacterium lentulum TaxID=2480588 RepID=UPI00161C1338|nr:hypothetical protein [Histidinibacterium lentulum]
MIDGDRIAGSCAAASNESQNPCRFQKPGAAGKAAISALPDLGRETVPAVSVMPCAF